MIQMLQQQKMSLFHDIKLKRRKVGDSRVPEPGSEDAPAHEEGGESPQHERRNTVFDGGGGAVVSGLDLRRGPWPTPDCSTEPDQPMVCMICQDKATGLHYGIITCEGCKGFFKRTVQNKRVYTCVGDGSCQVTKAQRNRCQYCRFQKCLRQGMVLAAVREDRMPGGRNSGAVYNLYKVKYKKHKKNPRNGTSEPVVSREWHSSPGQILKTALTYTPPPALECGSPNLVKDLVESDDFHDVATLHDLRELWQNTENLTDKLCKIGDDIVFKLVQWTKRLPFYPELPLSVHTQLLTHKWHELLILTTTAYHAIRGGRACDVDEAQGLRTLQACLGALMGTTISLDQLETEAGPLVRHLVQLVGTLRRARLTVPEYVCLKVVVLLSAEPAPEVADIRERYLSALRSEARQPDRYKWLLALLPQVQSAAAVLVQCKMFYVPFLLNADVT